jgi:lysophospholipase L1-like esterase
MLKNREIRPILFNCVAAGFLLVVFFSLLELGLRWRETGTKVIDKDWVQTNISFNKDGFRDKDYSFKKPDDVFRILIIGDSQTFGHGIDRLEETYPKKLETRLNTAAGSKKFEVLSFARPGWNSDSHLQYLYKKGLTYQPDLIMLSLYHNDILPPTFFDCDSTDLDLVDTSHFLHSVLNSSAIYNFLKFRINRGLEASGLKPNYIQCRKQVYNSRGWDMQRLYLDAIIGTAKKNKIHFMMTVIPVLFRLSDDYPMQFAHEKLAGFCADRDLPCVDFFEKGIQGSNARDFIVSEGDRHLNEKGAELIADVLFDKLRPLTAIKGLERFHRAFDLQELLEGGSHFEEISSGLNKLDSPDGMISASIKNFQLMAFKNVEEYSFVKSVKDPATGKRESLNQINLDKRGMFLSSEEVDYSPLDGKLIKKEKWTDTGNGKERRILIANKRGNLRTDEKEFYPFKYVSTFHKDLDKFTWSLEIRENDFFQDPFKFEHSIFQPERAKLKRPEGKEVFRALRFYKDFYLFEKSGKYYSDSLAQEIIDRAPYPEAVRAAKKYFQAPAEVLASLQ